MDKDFYSPGQIRFKRDEMIWLISWLPYMQEEGKWPPEYKETGYTGEKSNRNSIASFEIPSEYIAEVTYRLKTTGEAGGALVDEIQGGITDYEGLSRPAKRALNYISGWRRRNQTYPLWKADSKRRNKNHESKVKE